MDFNYIYDSSDIKIEYFYSDLYTSSNPIGFDTETSGLDFLTDIIRLLQFNVNNSIYIFDCEKLGFDFCKSILEKVVDSGRKLVAHNSKFDIKFVYNTFKILITNVWDTMWCETLLNAGVGETLYSLAYVVDKYCGVELVKDTRKDFYENFRGITQEMLMYSALDVFYLETIRLEQEKQIIDAKETLVWDLESRLIPVVSMMEYAGIKLDVNKWTGMAERNLQLYKETEKQLENSLLDSIDYSKFDSAITACDTLNIPVKTKRDRYALLMITGKDAIKEIVREKINLSSHKQLLTLLNFIGVPLDNTNEKSMKELNGKYEIINKILEFREQGKKESSYGLNFLKHIHPKTGRIHTEYMNMGTATGRMSSNNPNLQQVPRESIYRDCFIPEEGKSLLAIDFSQQEYRLVGAISREPVIIKAYQDGLDMHTATACLLTGKNPSEISKEERTYAKTTNFAIIYGSTEFGLSYNLKIAIEKGKEILNSFYRGYPVLAKFKSTVENLILEKRYSVTLLGRRRYFEEDPIFADSNEISRYRGRVKREGFNHVIQGTGADITKMSMVECFFNNPFGDKYKILLQVHDEIVVEVDDDIIDEATKFTKDTMEEVEQRFLGVIPAKAEAEVGKKWIH